MAKFTIKDLAEGRCAVMNDGTVEDLFKVLTAAFPMDSRIPIGSWLFYIKSNKISNCWAGYSNVGSVPIQSVKDFLKELEKPELPKRGDRILVSNDGKYWEEKVFLTYIEGAVYPVICVSYDTMSRFKKGKSFNTYSWKKWRPLPKKEVLEVTLEEVAKKFGVDEVKIVEKK